MCSYEAELRASWIGGWHCMHFMDGVSLALINMRRPGAKTLSTSSAMMLHHVNAYELGGVL